ncbi:MAG: hypothetical protein AAGH43_11620 [Pseudomonadota bacterium]
MRPFGLAVVASVSLLTAQAHACSGSAQTQVDAIFPSGAQVPENLLRFYLYFTAPMSTDDVLSSVSLITSDGVLVEGAFLSNRFDLWSPDRARLTVLFDPGRVKTGLDAHDALGRALEAGERYELRIDSGLRDAQGCSLAASFTHQFTATSGDIEPPDPSLWTVDAPQSGSRAPVRVRLGNAHDHLSMAYRIRVRDEDGETVPGRVELANAETDWLFHPRQAWSDQTYTVTVGEELEDLAGNRPGQLFDQPIAMDMPEPVLRLSFQPVSTGQ